MFFLKLAGISIKLSRAQYAFIEILLLYYHMFKWTIQKADHSGQCRFLQP